MKTTWTFARCSPLEARLWANLIFVIAMISSVTSAPVEDLIPSLPGQPDVAFKLYGGYVTVDEAHGRALYYYFVEAETYPSSKPLTLWLNGGPGCSSLGGGGFTELGPFFPSTNGKALIKNDYSWNQVANVIFLESPAGVGFSYSNTTADYTTGDVKTAQDSLTFLSGWFKKFPEYMQNDFFIAGESYAGHYAPQLASAILANNQVSGLDKIRLKGIMIGNPLINYIIDTVYSPVVFLWSHGLVSQGTYEIIMKNCKFSSSTEENHTCASALLEAGNEADYYSGFVDPYDVLEDVCYGSSLQEARLLKIMVLRRDQESVNEAPNPCVEEAEYKYLNLPEVQRALHAKLTSWSMCSGQIDYTEADLFTPMLPVLRHLLNSGLRVWIFSGDQDSIIPLIGTRELTDRLGIEFNKSVTSSGYRAWFQGKQVAGWMRTWGNLTFATVKGAGHMVPRTQGARALQLFTSYLAGDSLPSKPHDKQNR